MIFQNTKGQSLLEYSLILGIIVAIVMVMQPLIQRGFQGMIKLVADQIGTQEGAEQVFNKTEAHLETSYGITRSTLDQWVSQKEDEEMIYSTDEVILMNTTSFMNLGYTEPSPP